MDFKELWENIKEKSRLIFEKVKNYILENTMMSACVAALFLVIIIAIILLCAALKKPEEVKYERPVTLTEEMLVPPSPAMMDGYNSSRVTKEAWSKEEAEEWFTVPGKKELDDLSRANDQIINEITGAAP
ncbi:MAG: hypothetical protein MJ185_08220 [Treponema sp.]|nr:hypothetical protein [Treponema sp.]